MSATAAATQQVRISRLLKAAWPRATAKHAARASGGSVRTAQKWVADLCSPSAATLLRMAQRNADLRAELARLLHEAGTDDGLENVVAAPPRAVGAAARTEGGAG